MRGSGEQKQNQDILIIPSNKNNMNNPNMITNQIREVLYHVDNEHHNPRTSQKQLYEEIEELRNALARYEAEYDKIAHENEQMRRQLRNDYKEKNQEDKNKILDEKNALQAKYKKALVQINNLLGVNKQLKTELDSFKSRNNDKGKMTEQYANNERERQQLKFINHRLQVRVRELQSTNILYNNKFKQYENNIKVQRQQFQTQLVSLSNALKNKEIELKEIRHKSETKHPLNENENELKMMIERYKNQEVSLINEIRNLHQHILDLENHMNESKLEYEKQAERKNNEIHEISLKFRRENQDQIFSYKSEINSLREANGNMEREKQKMGREILMLKEKSVERQREESRFEIELKGQIDNLKNQINRLKEIIGNKEQFGLEISNLNKEIQNLNTLNQQLEIENSSLREKISERENIKPSVSESRQLKQVEVNIDKSQETPEIEFLRTQNDLLKKRILACEFDPLPETNRKLTQNQQILNQQGVMKINEIHKLQQRIHEFRARIEILLTDKQNVNMASHEKERQFASMKVFINELDEKLRVINGENQEYSKKLREKKEKVSSIQRKSEILAAENKTLLAKVKGYDQLVSKLEMEMEKLIKMNQTSGQGIQNQLRSYIADLKDRIVLQQKYFKQQLQTNILEYESKILIYKAELEQIKTNFPKATKIESHNQQSYIVQLQQDINKAKQNLEYMLYQWEQERQRYMGIVEARNSEITELKERLKIVEQSKYSEPDRAEITRYVQELQKLKTIVRQVEIQNQNIENQKNQLVYTYESRIGELNRKYHQEMQSISQSQNQDLSHSQLKEEIRYNQETLSRREKQIENLQRIIKQNQAMYIEQSENVQYQLENLRSTIKLYGQIHQRLNNKEIQLAEKNQIIGDLERTIKEHQLNNNEDLKKSIKEKEAECIFLKNTIDNLVSENRMLTTQVQYKDRAESNLRQQFRMFEIEYRKLQEFVRSQDGSFEEVTSRLQVKQAEVEKIRKIAEERNSDQVRTIQVQSKRIIQLSQQLQQVKSMSVKNARIQQQLLNEKNESELLRSEIEERMKRNRELEQKLRTAQFNEKTLIQIEKTYSELQLRYDADTKKLQYEREKVVRSNKMYEQEIEELYKASNKHRIEYNTHVRQSNIKIQELEQHNQRLLSELTRMQGEFDFRFHSLMEERNFLHNEFGLAKQEIQRIRLNREGPSIQVRGQKSNIDDYQYQNALRENERLVRIINELDERLKESLMRLQQSDEIVKKYQYQIYELKLEIQKYENLKQGNAMLYDEIQRLQKIISELEADISSLRMRYCGESNHEQRIQENLAIFVLIFAEIESLRIRIKDKEAEIQSLHQTHRRDLKESQFLEASIERMTLQESYGDRRAKGYSTFAVVNSKTQENMLTTRTEEERVKND